MCISDCSFNLNNAKDLGLILS